MSSSSGSTSTTPTRKEIDALGEILGLHELAVEDTQEFGQRPKADAYGEELLLVYYGASEVSAYYREV